MTEGIYIMMEVIKF